MIRSGLIGLILGVMLLTGSAGRAYAPQRAAAPVVGISVDTLKRHTQTLSSDAFEGRKPGTPGEEKAVRYIADQFAALGLTPGNNGSWFQDVPLVEITTDPSAKLVVSGRTPLSFDYGKDVVLWTKRAQERVAVDESDVVFVGYGINAPERGWNDYAGVDAKGKTVIILINDADWEAKASGKAAGPFDGRAMTYYGRWTYKYEEAARQGAAAAIIIHQEVPAAYPWSTVISSWTGPQLSLDRPDGGMNRAAVEGWITKEAAERLLKAGGQDLAQLAAAASQKGFRAVPLPLKAGTLLTNRVRRSNSKNVIAVLPGSERPNEYVIYSAHWDHLGHCPPDETGDDICNGAFDNATGIAGLLALAESYKATGAPKRSVVFLAVTSEEANLLGSQYYAENPVYPLKDTVANINMDGLNILGRTADVVVIGAGKSELEERLATAVAAQGRVLTVEPTPEKGFFYRSDHFSLAKLGVPAIHFDSGTDVRGKGKAWGQAKADEYTARCYHKPCDEYDPNWDWSGAVEDLSLNYRLGRDLADSAAWPNWYPIAEFRAVRDRSRGGE